MYNVLIPTAKIVSEQLQALGKLPPIIYPVNDGIVFDHLYEQYRDTCSNIRVVCHEKAEKVKKCLDAYQSALLEIVKLDQLEDLGHSIYVGLTGMEGCVVINFADTIVLDNICDIGGDCFFCIRDEVSDKWTFFDETDGEITSVYDKVPAPRENEAMRLFVGVFKFMDAGDFRSCLERAFRGEPGGKYGSVSSFYRALVLYSRCHPLVPVETNHWFDIGHLDRYYDTQLAVKARAFNHISIDRERGILTKTSERKEKFIGEILWYIKLPSDIEYVRPRIFSYSTDYNNPYVKMEYYSYHTLHELFLHGDLSVQQWKDIFNRIRFVCNDLKRYVMKDAAVRRSLEEMYCDKTLERLGKLSGDSRFAAFFSDTVTVNGIRYLPLRRVCDRLAQAIPRMLYDIDQFHIIHGDLCFANIMVDSNFSFVKLIDPRGRFGEYDIYGDRRYELAKLFHSVDGKYDFIIKDLFEIQYDLDKAAISYAILDQGRGARLYQVFRNTFRAEIGNDLKKIELIEALLFLSMIPLHGENLKHQLVMLGTGLEILNRVVDIKA